jgi:putative nucleotidyltransferase with HDIG domain
MSRPAPTHEGEPGAEAQYNPRGPLPLSTYSAMANHYSEIEQVVIDTFALWDVRRVGFSWRKYYMDHTRQVQNLALRMAADLDADPDQLRHAAILHDITKRYDGAILKDAEGKSVLDEEGFWLNETINPDRYNWITGLYERLGLGGQIHHVSGGVLTEHVLREFGFAENFVRPVTKIVRGHLKGKVPPEVHDERYKETEVRILYDADTIDPNVGFTAFYRNIQINAGGALSRGETIDLRTYVEKLPGWVSMKDSFRDQMLTERGKELCDERQARNRELARSLQAELADEAVNRRYGLLGAVEYLFTNPEDPSLHEHAASLRDAWLPERRRLLSGEAELDRDAATEALARSSRFVQMLQDEIDGVL